MRRGTKKELQDWQKQDFDENIGEDYEQKCVSEVKAGIFVKVRGILEKSDINDVDFMIQTDDCIWYIDNNIYDLDEEREPQVGDLVTLYGRSRNTAEDIPYGYRDIEADEADDNIEETDDVNILYINAQRIKYY